MRCQNHAFSPRSAPASHLYMYIYHHVCSIRSASDADRKQRESTNPASSPWCLPCCIFSKQMDGCSFLHGSGDDASRREPQQQRRRRLIPTTTVLGLVLNQGLLLVIVSVGLVVLLVWICWLERWLCRHPDGLDRFLPSLVRNLRHRRVHHVSSSPHAPS